MIFLAASGVPDPVSLDPLAAYGVVGMLAAIGLWFMYRAYNREVTKHDEGEAECKREREVWIAKTDALNQLIRDKYVPALEASTAAVAAALDLMRRRP